MGSALGPGNYCCCATPTRPRSNGTFLVLPEEKRDIVYKRLRRASERDGKVSYNEFTVAINNFTMPEIAENMFHYFDPLSTGFVTLRFIIPSKIISTKHRKMELKDFFLTDTLFRAGNMESKLNKLFEIWDPTGDGTLSKELIFDLARAVVKKRMSVEEGNPELNRNVLAHLSHVVDCVFERMDADQTGILDRIDFVEGFSNVHDVCLFFKFL
ncbi:hypothetical protein Pelo_6061 [Pelomyxa schiedti]|nr:hypothetical protein Pelo_6061 [Pelomyxa schiedti]